MANYNNLLSTINGAIKTNGEGFITGQRLQTILDGMVASLGAKYQYAGVAAPSTNPGTPDENVFYLASQAGTYTNFGGLVVNDGEVCALKWDGTWTKDITGAATAEQVSQLGQYAENLEWVKVVTDSNDNILYGVRADGKFYFGAGCPPQVKDYINTYGYDKDAIDALLATKVNKVSGESLINAEFASAQDVVENPEWLEVSTDENGKALEGIKTDGKKVIDIPVSVHKDIDMPSGKIGTIENTEYLQVEIDRSGKILSGTKKDGSHYIHNVKSESIDALDKEIEEKLNPLSETFSIEENPEFLNVETDADGKILSARTKDGVQKEFVGFESPSVASNGSVDYGIEDKENRVEVTTDAEEKVVSYRGTDGVLNELVGVKTDKLKAKSFSLPGDSREEVKELAIETRPFKKLKLPEFGYVDLISETFYLTAAGWSSYQNDVELRQDYPDTDENAVLKITISNFYIKGTSTKLDFYAATLVTKVSDKYYVTSTLTEVEDPETHEISYEVNENSIEVRQCTDVPPIHAWPVDKSTKHQCVTTIDFGEYLNGTFYVLVSYQGSSTLMLRKRNFRFTFYKNNNYEKKLKLKIGELPRQSGFNLKANFSDNSRIKELSMYRLLLSVWEEKPLYRRFPWSDNEDVAPYTCATGFIQGFNVEVRLGGTFQGLFVFGLKKDKGNYLIEDDENGILVCAEHANWSTADASTWENEIEDEMPQDTADALDDFFAFLRSGNVTRETAPQRMDVLAWLDYTICLQVFYMPDNIGRNMILYSNEEKYKFTPFFYDLDLSLNFYFSDYKVDFYTAPWPDGLYEKDFLPYNLMMDLYWDEILGRYDVLRKTALSIPNIQYVFDNALKSIPESVLALEESKWGVTDIKTNQSVLVDTLIKRILWLDKNIFNN